MKIYIRNNTLTFNNKNFICAVGRAGVGVKMREGDGLTPLGTYNLRECWYRADRIATPETLLPLRVIQPEDGWCDDPASELYNRHITVASGEWRVTKELSTLHPPPPHENLWREDHLYDLIIPIGYNDNPVVPGKGSAIFLHVAHDDYRPTEGCVALKREDLLGMLPLLGINSQIVIAV